ncbi:hypothetical protein [Nitrosovibrio sp. Nv17]|uniref:hypothetical protein n=1 Tax=Nitrosovibrio sp. Nv17 TaxID=1855339 RepID=UPI00116028F6|nr:hypothetical protein [Nitrosovibrio sp. Nv17]
MPLLADYSLSATFSGVDVVLQAQGLNVAGDASPLGIPEHIEIVNGVAKLTVRETDIPTYGERRS